MSKAPQLFSPYPQDTNLSTNKKVYKATTYKVSNINEEQDEKKAEIEKKSATHSSFRVFKYLIVTTVIIFAFGGFGFGMALRFNQSSANVTPSTNLNK